MVRQEAGLALAGFGAFAHLVGIFFARQERRFETVADFHALDGIDAHQRAGQLAVQLGIDGRAQPGGNAFGYQLYNRAAGRTLLAQAFQIFRPHRHRLGIGTEEIIARHLRPIKALDALRAHRHQRAAHRDLAIKRCENFARNRARRHPRRGFAGAGTAAAAIIAHAIFGPIGVVGMAGAELVADLAIVFRALVLVLDQQRDGRARGHLLLHALVLEHAGQDLHRVGFAPLGDEFRRAGAAAIQVFLDIGHGEGNAGRAAIHHATQRRAMAFAKGGDAKHVAETVEAHGSEIALFALRV